MYLPPLTVKMYWQTVSSTRKVETADQPPYVVCQGDTRTAVARALFGFLPHEGWERCTIHYQALSMTAETQARLVNVDGTAALIATATELRFALKHLRDLMAGEEGRA